MDTHDNFLPSTLNQWLSTIAIVIGWSIVVWRALLNIKTDINNQGSKINAIEIESAKAALEIDTFKIELQRSIDDRNTMRERIAANARGIDALREDIQDDRLAVLTTLHNNEKAAAERSAALGEQLARLQERMNMEELIKATLRAMERFNHDRET